MDERAAMLSNSGPLKALNQTIVFHVLVPGSFLSRAQARKSDTCGLLSHLFPRQAISFIYNGQLLNESLTIGFYGIKDMETIIAVPKPTDRASGVLDHWVRISRDPEWFENSVKSLTMESTQREAMRLRDVVIMKRELAAKGFRRYVRQVPRPDPTDVLHTTNIPQRPERPSTETLPVPW
jgi:hypothetical protein